MADRIVPGPVSGNDSIREAVCIDTKKIMDSCRDKDCIEDLFYWIEGNIRQSLSFDDYSIHH